MAEFAYTEALRVLGADASADLGRLLAAACAPGCDPVVYLADFSRQVLLPQTAGVPEEQVEGTMAGRAFTTGEPAASGRDGYARVWVPVLEQTARAGVLALSLPDAGPGSVRQAELLGVFAGLVSFTVGLVVLVAVQLSVLGLYLPPVFNWVVPLKPPQTIISVPVQTAV